jgi:hypothetical protein
MYYMTSINTSRPSLETRFAQFCAGIEREFGKLPPQDAQTSGLNDINRKIRALSVETFISAESACKTIENLNSEIWHAINRICYPSEMLVNIQNLEINFLASIYAPKGGMDKSALINSVFRASVLSRAQPTAERYYPRFPEALACSTGLDMPTAEAFKVDPRVQMLMGERLHEVWKQCLSFYQGLQDSYDKKSNTAALDCRLLERVNHHMNWIFQDLEKIFQNHMSNLTQSMMGRVCPPCPALPKPENPLLEVHEGCEKLVQEKRIRECIDKCKELSSDLQKSCGKHLEVFLFEQQMMESVAQSTDMLVSDLQDIANEL